MAVIPRTYRQSPTTREFVILVSPLQPHILGELVFFLCGVDVRDVIDNSRNTVPILLVVDLARIDRIRENNPGYVSAIEYLADYRGHSLVWA